MKKFLYIFIIFLIFISLIFAVLFVKHKIPKSVKPINIVFTTDINYKNYLKTTINSAVKNKNKDSVYNINIIGVDLNNEQLKVFKSFESDNVHINLMPLPLNMLNGIGMYKIDYHVTRADLFKFLMPDLFPNLDKILYIDVDTVILKDLSDLYNTNIGNKYIGVVHKSDSVFIWEKRLWYWVHKPYYEYNCGVILYNLKQWRKKNLKNLLIENKNTDQYKGLMSQYTFNNVITKENVFYLSPIYNVLIQWDKELFERNNFKKAYKPYLNKINSIDELYENAVIIHYADKIKPWDAEGKKIHYVDLWEKYRL